MRLSQQDIQTITGYQKRSSQKRWFKDYMGVDVPVDRVGVILTESAYDALVKKRLGVMEAANSDIHRPQVRLNK